MTKNQGLMAVSCLIIASFLLGLPVPAHAKFPTILELKTSPDPAWIRDTVLIECRLFAKGASHTTQRAKGGILSVTIYSLSPSIQVNQFVDKPDGRYDLFEFSWKPPRAGRYKIEASYSGSGFLSAVRTSQTVTVTQTPPRVTTTVPPTTTTIRVFVPATTLPPTTTTLPPTTTTWPPTTTLPPTTTTWPPTTTTLPPPTTTFPPAATLPPPATTLLPPETTLGQPAGTGLEETTIGPEPGAQPPAAEETGPAQAQEPLRADDGKIVTKVSLTVKSGPRAGQYLVTVEAIMAGGGPLDDGDVLVTVSGGTLIPGAQGQALLSAVAGRQTLVWQEPAKAGTGKYRLEATYFGGTGPQGDYRMASASLLLPPDR